MPTGTRCAAFRDAGRQRTPGQPGDAASYSHGVRLATAIAPSIGSRRRSASWASVQPLSTGPTAPLSVPLRSGAARTAWSTVTRSPMPWWGWPRCSVDLAGPVQIVLHNRAFDPAAHVAGPGPALVGRLGGCPGQAPRAHPELDPRAPAADARRPATYARAVAAIATRAPLRQVRCVVLLAQPPRRRPWWTRGSRAPGPRAQLRALDAALERLGTQLDKARWPSQRLWDLDLHDLVEETLRSAPTGARRQVVAPTRRHTAGRVRVEPAPGGACAFSIADLFPEWIACHQGHLEIQGPGPRSHYVRILALRDYPPEVEVGWLHWFATQPNDLDLALVVAPIDDPMALRTHVATSQPRPPEPDPAVTSALEEPVRLVLVLGIRAESVDTLRRTTQDAATALGARGFHLTRAPARQLDGLRSLLPLVDHRLHQWHTISAGPVAAALPLHALGRADPGGIVVGTTLGSDRGKAPVIVNPAAAESSPRHVLVLGRTRSDVTDGLMRVALGLWLQGGSPDRPRSHRQPQPAGRGPAVAALSSRPPAVVRQSMSGT